MIVKSLKPLLEQFSKIVLLFSIRTDLLYWYCFLVFLPISNIGTTFLYLYRSSVSVPFSCIMTYDNDIYLSVITWLMLVITWHLFDITYHLPPDTWLLDLWLSHLRKSCLDVLYYIKWPESIVVMYSCNFLNLSCTCHSLKLIII